MHEKPGDAEASWKEIVESMETSLPAAKFWLRDFGEEMRVCESLLSALC